MLFDLRGSGRRTTVKVVYLTLAILMGGGLILFGIGGDVSGGLVDAITEQGSSSGSGKGSYEERVRTAQRRTQAEPRNPAAWAELTRARYQLATVGDSFDQKQPDDGVASLMVQAYSQAGLNDAKNAVRAQEVITEQRPSSNAFATLAVLAYQAGDTRKGDLARNEAVDRADKADRNTLKSDLDQAKQQAIAQQVQQAGGTPQGGGGDGGGTGGGGG